MPVVSEELVGQRAELGLPSKRAAAGSCGMPVVQVNKNGGKRDKKVSDDVRDRIRATSSIGGVRIVSLGCGEVLGTHEPTRFNHNMDRYMTFKKRSKYRIKSLFSALSHAKTVSNGRTMTTRSDCPLQNALEPRAASQRP